MGTIAGRFSRPEILQPRRRNFQPQSHALAQCLPLPLPVILEPEMPHGIYQGVCERGCRDPLPNAEGIPVKHAGQGGEDGVSPVWDRSVVKVSGPKDH